MILNSRLVVYYTTIFGRRYVYSSMMKNGEWRFELTRHGMFASNRLSRLNGKYDKVVNLSPSPTVVKHLNMSVVRLNDGKVLRNMSLDNKGITDYTMMLNYCDEDLLSYLEISREKYDTDAEQEEFKFSF